MKPVLAVVGALVLVGGGGYGAYALMAGDDDAADAPSRYADALFAADRAAAGDGLDQAIGDVAVAGGMAVAAGSESGGPNARPKFLYSKDGGRTWQLATVRTRDGGQALGQGPDVVFGVKGAWVALGTRNGAENVWTSADGTTWTQRAAKPGVFAVGDQIEQVARAGDGFVAVGHRPWGGRSVPVLWRSADGTEWQRVTGRSLGLKAGKNSVGPLRYVASAGRTTLIAGTVVKKAGTVAGLWGSTDGGRSWREMATPSASGAWGDLHLAVSGNRFVALRRGKAGNARPGVAFTSPDGRRWQAAGKVENGPVLEPVRLAGGDAGLALLAGVSDDRKAVFQSGDGTNWAQAADLGNAPGRTLSSIASAGGTALVGGSRRQADEDYQLISASGGRSAEVDLSKVTGATATERSLLDVASGGGRTVAVGSTNGRAAIWTTGDGDSWERADAKALAADARQRLVKVAHGPQGWLAVGAEGGRPLVVTSADGRTWQRQDPSAFAPHGGRVVTLTGVAAGPKGYLIVGRDARGTAESSALAWHSADLRTWRPAQRGGLAAGGGTSREMTAVAATPNGFAAVGATANGGAPTAKPSEPAIWVSQDGLAWTQKEAVAPAGVRNIRLTHVTANGRALVAAGEGDQSGFRAVAIVSTDGGSTWRGSVLPTPTGDSVSYLRAAAAGESGFTLVGMFGSWLNADTIRWTSPDGRAWQPSVPQGPGLSGDGRQQVTAVAGSGDGLLGVGTSAEDGRDRATLWRFDAP